MTKKERLERYLEYKRIKPTAFAKAIAISNSHVSEINTRKNNRTLYLAIRSSPDFSDCNTEWIDTGEGEMLMPARQVGIASVEKRGIREQAANDYRSSADRMAVVELKRSISEDGWALLDSFELLCDEQKKSLLIVAQTMALGVPTKSPPKGPGGKS